MTEKSEKGRESTTRFLVVNLLKIYGSLIGGIGLIVFFVAPEYAFPIIGGVLLVATILFVGGYVLASSSNQNKPEASDDGSGST